LRIESARQIDQFGKLNLGQSDDENDDQDQTRAPDDVLISDPLPSNLPESGASIEPKSTSKSRTSKKKSKNKRKTGGSNAKASKWADKCMYAELLEMSVDESWNAGLPEDLETGWVAVGPVPAGKRCLAVTHQSSGINGVSA
jgi:snurportin-1